ncbi:hypothetical protein [Photorhabdus sp. CRCIA-P01]|nr:hypothetical protein [Photorhabdus sp. CRCIA-P01]
MIVQFTPGSVMSLRAQFQMLGEDAVNQISPSSTLIAQTGAVMYEV